MSGVDGLVLLRRRHAKYLSRVLKVLPDSASGFDTARMTIAFFVLSGLDVLSGGGDDEAAVARELLQDPEERERCRRWIRALYVHDERTGLAGFHGGTSLKVGGKFLRPDQHVGHAAMTYTALACLHILRDPADAASDPLRGLDAAALARGVGALQRGDGSFDSATEGGENDMRFVFCAAAACHMLRDWSGVDGDAVARYVRRSQCYDGGIAQGPGMEAHGGSTYCALATLRLMGRLNDTFTPRNRRKLVRWCVNRLTRDPDSGHCGFNGRPNKPVDTCYSFWVGASLAILLEEEEGQDQKEFPDRDLRAMLSRCSSFTLCTQDPLTGGLAKMVDTATDPLHTYLGLAGLALTGDQQLSALNPNLNATSRALPTS